MTRIFNIVALTTALITSAACSQASPPTDTHAQPAASTEIAAPVAPVHTTDAAPQDQSRTDHTTLAAQAPELTPEQQAQQQAYEAAVANIDHALTEAPDDHVIGDVKAPATIITYASVTCPHCSDWFTNQWPGVKKDLVDTGKIRFIFREFPTAPAQLAMAGFLIANCADETKFFDNIVAQMVAQKDIMDAAAAGKGQETYLEIAQKAGLKDQAAMDACFTDKAGFDQINRSMLRAEAAGVDAVPSFFINGERYKGDQSVKALASQIAAANAGGITALPKDNMTKLPKKRP